MFVAKQGNFARTFVKQGQGFAIFDPFQFGRGIFGRLFRHHIDILTHFKALGLDDADGLALDEKQIIRRSFVGRIFTYGNACGLAKIDLVFILYRPPGVSKHAINLAAGNLFRGFIGISHEKSLELRLSFTVIS